MDEAKRTYHRKYNRKRYQRCRTGVITSLGGACVVCGATTQLEIDHKDPTVKTMNVSMMWAYSRSRVEKELKLCQLLCKPCHIEKPFATKGSSRQRIHMAHSHLTGIVSVTCVRKQSASGRENTVSAFQENADVAKWIRRLFCNEETAGSIPVVSSSSCIGNMLSGGFDSLCRLQTPPFSR